MITFRVEGRPAPQGSKAFKGMRKGKPILAEQCKSVKPWRAAVKAAAQVAMIGREKLRGPVCLIVTFYMPTPKSVPKERRGMPSTSPDLSKLIRAIEDAMTDAEVWADDGQVCHVNAVKCYCAHSNEVIGASINAFEIDALLEKAMPSLA